MENDTNRGFVKSFIIMTYDVWIFFSGIFMFSGYAYLGRNNQYFIIRCLESYREIERGCSQSVGKQYVKKTEE